VVLKSGQDREMAEKYAKALVKVGLVCDILPPVEAVVPAPAAPTPGFEPAAPARASESLFEPSARDFPAEIPPVAAPALSEPVAPAAFTAEESVDDVFAESPPRPFEPFPVMAEAPVPPGAAGESVAPPEPIMPAPAASIPTEGATPFPAPEAPWSQPAAPAGEVSDGVLAALKGTRPWVRLLSILLFLGAALGILGVVLMLAGSMLSGLGGGGEGAPLMLIAVFQGLACLLYLVPAYFLFKYSAAIDALVKGGGMGALETALGHQKSFWRFSGILALIGLIIGVLGMLAAILIPGLVGYR
jgi:hypothetical protein